MHSDSFHSGDRRDKVEWTFATPSPNPSDAPADSQATQPEAQPRTGAPNSYLRIWFECARQYARAYPNPDSSAYIARCPTCGNSRRFPIGPGGTSERFFRVTCR